MVRLHVDTGKPVELAGTKGNPEPADAAPVPGPPESVSSPPSNGTNGQVGRDPRPYAEMSVLYFPVRALLDTGATRSYLGPLVWDELRSVIPESEIQSASAMIMPNGELESTAGEVSLPVHLGAHEGVLHFRIAPKLMYEAILGIDGIKKLRLDLPSFLPDWMTPQDSETSCAPRF